MHTRFFPINSAQEIVNRQTLILSEYHTFLPESVPIWQFMALSDKAHARREERLKAARDGRQYIG